MAKKMEVDVNVVAEEIQLSVNYIKMRTLALRNFANDIERDCDQIEANLQALRKESK